MRIMLDTKVWVEFKKNSQFLNEFREFYTEKDLDIIFSHGNFLDMVRRDEQDELSSIIVEFADEYLGPINPKSEEGTRRSENPLILATIDNDWYEYCRIGSLYLNDVDTLKAMFRDGYFDDEAIVSLIHQHIDSLRDLEDIDVGDRMDIPEGKSREVALKEVGVFAEYAKLQEDGRYSMDDADVPSKWFIFAMSIVYMSDVYITEDKHELDGGDYRDMIIWYQAIISGCDVLWIEKDWKYKYPVIDNVLEHLERKPLHLAQNFPEFKEVIG